MNGRNEGVGWPSAAVACTLILLVGGVTVTAILRYDVENVLKIWAALSAVVGILTGAFVTFFFTRGTVEAEKRDAAAAQNRATEAYTEATAARERTKAYQAGLLVAERHLDPTARAKMTDLEKEALQRVLRDE